MDGSRVRMNVMAKQTARASTPRTGKTRNNSETLEANNGAPADQATDVGAPAADATRATSMASEPSDEEIRRRAYIRYLERGATDGRDFDDWLEAERELRSLG
jgi:hypothetical protein